MAIGSAMAQRAGGGRRRRRRGARGAINEINMTPFIDVMLVLLIIFMVAAPLMTAGVPLDLPQTKAAPLNIDAKPVTLSIKADGQVFLGETELAGRRHRRQARGGGEAGLRRAHLRARRQEGRLRPRRPGDVDRDRAGYKRVALVTEADQR